MSLSEGTDNINHKAWIDKIKSELKGKDLQLYDYIWDGIHISPFEEIKPVRRRLSKKENNEWYIGAEIEQTLEELNKGILETLELGASAIRLHINQSATWKKVFHGIHLDWIHTEYSLEDLNLFNDLMKVWETYPLGDVKGICWVNENIQIDLFKKYQVRMPGLRFITIQVQASDTSATIARIFKNLLDRISLLSDLFEPAVVLNGIAIRLNAGEDVVLNLSMVRALRLIWMQALSAAGMDEYAHEIFISAKVPHIMPTPSDQMISASFIATSLVLGGIDALFIALPDQKKPDQRWGLMAQHILHDEAMLNKYNDPFSGSNIIERLTEVIAKKIWESII